MTTKTKKGKIVHLYPKMDFSDKYEVKFGKKIKNQKKFVIPEFIDFDRVMYLLLRRV